MREFEFNEIKNNFYSIEQDDVRSFMIVGDESILLVDSGRGGNKLIEQIRNVSKLPIKLIFTHSDKDHIGDAEDFKERFMHPSEYAYYYTKSSSPLKMNALWEGELINIADYCFKVILIPGHTPGSIALLEANHRFIIGGDSLQRGPIYMFGEGRNFQAFRDSLKKLMHIKTEFDWIYPSHHKLKLTNTVIEQLLAASKKMIAGELKGKSLNNINEDVKLYKSNGVSFLAY